MRHNFRNRTAKSLVQIAAVLFFVNSAVAYGACCLGDLAVNDPVAQEAPCHTVESHQSESDDTEVGAENCCVSCVPGLQMSGLVSLDLDHALRFQTQREPTFRAAEVAQPFRPPINA